MDHYTLQVIWFILLAILAIGFVVLDGFDMGVCILLPLICKTEEEKRIVINSIGPVWERNPVWLIIATVAAFAAWPILYAAIFSILYIPMFVILASLIIRPVAFKLRKHIEHTFSKNIWDTCFFLSGFLPSFLFGVAVYSILQGLPFIIDESHGIIYKVNFLDLISFGSISVGVFSVFIVVMQGAAYLIEKTEGRIKQISNKIVFVALPVVNLLFLILLLNYSSSIYSNKILLVFLCMCIRYIPFKKKIISTSLSIASMIGIVAFFSFPNLLSSTINPSHSLTILNASSSDKTLMIMFISVLIFLPIVILYTSWLYKVFKGKTDETIY